MPYVPTYLTVPLPPSPVEERYPRVQGAASPGDEGSGPRPGAGGVGPGNPLPRTRFGLSVGGQRAGFRKSLCRIYPGLLQPR